MQNNQFSLFLDRRFSPLFVTQFLGAFHDNLFKNALVVLLLFDVSTGNGNDPKLLTTIAAGLFILPFILFSFLGGQLADKYPKQKVISLIKLIEVLIACLGVAALIAEFVWLSFFVLFALGTQSAFFGPSKYSILPQLIKDDELIAGNALLNTGSFLAILFGTIIGTVFITAVNGPLIVGILMLVCAAIGYVSSRKILPVKAQAPDLCISYNFFKQTINILQYVFAHNSKVSYAALGVAWFYFLGGMYLAQLPNFTKDTVAGNESVLSFFLVLFSVGVAIGGLLNNRLLNHEIKAVLVPYALIGVSIFSFDLYFSSSVIRVQPLDEINLLFLVSNISTIRIVFDMFMIALCGGLMVVPLQAIIQHFTEERHRARVVAGSAILNAVFIFVSSLFSGVLIGLGYKIEEIFLVFAALNIIPLLISWFVFRNKFDE
jgi:acyl-[acyl-carrier-protein]-phospholipid O-acyltransferase/long-chain-fatty-acid--[acyl-carrier-protein] ligase